MKYLDTRSLETLSEDEMTDIYEEYVYWIEHENEQIPVNFEQWLNTQIEIGNYEICN